MEVDENQDAKYRFMRKTRSSERRKPLSDTSNTISQPVQNKTFVNLPLSQLSDSEKQNSKSPISKQKLNVK